MKVKRCTRRRRLKLDSWPGRLLSVSVTSVEAGESFVVPVVRNLGMGSREICARFLHFSENKVGTRLLISQRFVRSSENGLKKFAGRKRSNSCACEL